MDCLDDNDLSAESIIMKFIEEDEEDDEMALILFVAAAADARDTKKIKRQAYYVRDRLEWDKHVEELFEEGEHSFSRLYRMSYMSFMTLCSIIHPFVKMNEKMSCVRTGKGPILTEIMLHCLLRWLGGGSYLDIRLSAGLSTS